MIELSHSRDELLGLTAMAVDSGYGRIHLDPLVGVYGPAPYIEAGTMKSMLEAFTGSEPVMRWDGGMSLSILRSD